MPSGRTRTDGPPALTQRPLQGEREARESSTAKSLSRGRAARTALADAIIELDLQLGPVPRQLVPTPRRGRALASEPWLEELNPEGLAELASDSLRGESVVGDALFAAVAQLGEIPATTLGWEVRLAPIVVRAGPSQRVRIGYFTSFTDRDGFIAALLGQPVPRRPWHLASLAPAVVHLEGDLVDLRAAIGFMPADGLGLYQLPRAAALDRLGDLRAVLRRVMAHDPATSGVLDRLLSDAPRLLAESNLLRLLAAVARGGPRWRSPGKAIVQVAAFDLGGPIRLGFAWWTPGQARGDRARLAAHLRYVFDVWLAPWQAIEDPHARRELFTVATRAGCPALGLAGHSVPEVARALRAYDPPAYAAESVLATKRRLYRLSARLKRLQRAA